MTTRRGMELKMSPMTTRRGMELKMSPYDY